MKKLYKSKTNKVWKGILGGIGEYFNIDPVLLRIAFIFFVLATGLVPGVLTYIIAIFVIPDQTIPFAETSTE
jgi:phage shock protein C